LTSQAISPESLPLGVRVRPPGSSRGTKARKLTANVATYVVLSVAGIVGTGPIVYLLATSLTKTFAPIVSLSALGHPAAINYEQIWTQYPVGRWMVNSLIFAGGVTVFSLLLDSAAGFAFAKLRFGGSKLLFSLLLLAVMIPLPVTLLTTYLLVDDLGMLNTYQGLILPVLSYPVGVFLMRQFIQAIPTELLDAARIDGMSEFRIYLRLILPMSVPGLAILALYIFMTQWSSLLWPLLASTSDAVRTIQPGLASMPAQYSENWGLISAATLVSIVPVLVVFLFLQRYLTRGVVGGFGTKG
jgi:multiple sugar transport system permease protein